VPGNSSPGPWTKERSDRWKASVANNAMIARGISQREYVVNYLAIKLFIVLTTSSTSPKRVSKSIVCETGDANALNWSPTRTVHKSPGSITICFYLKLIRY
jgi:hypothetical protein